MVSRRRKPTRKYTDPVSLPMRRTNTVTLASIFGTSSSPFSSHSIHHLCLQIGSATPLVFHEALGKERPPANRTCDECFLAPLGRRRGVAVFQTGVRSHLRSCRYRAPFFQWLACLLSLPLLLALDQVDLEGSGAKITTTNVASHRHWLGGDCGRFNLRPVRATGGRVLLCGPAASHMHFKTVRKKRSTTLRASKQSLRGPHLRGACVVLLSTLKFLLLWCRRDRSPPRLRFELFSCLPLFLAIRHVYSNGRGAKLSPTNVAHHGAGAARSRARRFGFSVSRRLAIPNRPPTSRSHGGWQQRPVRRATTSHVDFQSVRKECPATILARQQHLVIPLLQSLFIVLFLALPFSHLNWLWHRSPLSLRLQRLVRFPFPGALGCVDLNGCGAELSPADVAHHSIGSRRRV